MAVTFLSKLGDEIVSFTFFMWRHCPSLWYTVVLQGISAGGRGLTLLHFFPSIITAGSIVVSQDSDESLSWVLTQAVFIHVLSMFISIPKCDIKI